jgi:GTP-binding protein HflX
VVGNSFGTRQESETDRAGRCRAVGHSLPDPLRREVPRLGYTSGNVRKTSAGGNEIPRKRPRSPEATNSDHRNGTTRRERRGTGAPRSTAPVQERAYLVGVDMRQPDTMSLDESMRELGRLVRTAGGTVVGTTTQRRARPAPATFVGSGKIDEIVAARETTNYTMVVFDDALSPSQQLNVEQALGVKVLDRSALILDIFASRAWTREATLQVELAQHEYLLPRLRGQWQHLERTEGAIGARGPGETQLETDRRLIGARITRLKSGIKTVKKQRAQQRARRERFGVPTVALVGYTNAGKSSLMRALAGANVFAADAPFATLDPVTRRVGSGTAESFLLTDTVGFMQKLPTELVSAFRATLEELNTADLLLHVVDATSTAIAAQHATVLRTLDDLGLSEVPMLTVLNKADGVVRTNGQPVAGEEDLDTLPLPELPGMNSECRYASATAGWGIDALRIHLLYEFFGATLEAQPVG